MGKIIRKLNVLLDRKQKVTMAGLLVMMLIGAVLEVASIGIVVPVVTIVMDENAVFRWKASDSLPWLSCFP